MKHDYCLFGLVDWVASYQTCDRNRSQIRNIGCRPGQDERAECEELLRPLPLKLDPDQFDCVSTDIS